MVAGVNRGIRKFYWFVFACFFMFNQKLKLKLYSEEIIIIIELCLQESSNFKHRNIMDFAYTHKHKLLLISWYLINKLENDWILGNQAWFSYNALWPHEWMYMLYWSLIPQLVYANIDHFILKEKQIGIGTKLHSHIYLHTN